MEARLQRRVQRYGWDLAAAAYEPLWRTQLAGAHARLLASAALAPGERVLDVACGTGIAALAAAAAVGPDGAVTGVDLSERMAAAARERALAHGVANARFARMDAEALHFADSAFDAALCALGLMYVPHPARALAEMHRVVRPGGRVALAGWGERARCGWSALFPIVAAEIASEVCPLFFELGRGDALDRLCRDAGFTPARVKRFAATLDYADADDACDAAFVGGPVALAWSRFDPDTQKRVCRRYLEAIAPFRRGQGYRIPGEFVVATAVKPSHAGALASRG